MVCSIDSYLLRVTSQILITNKRIARAAQNKNSVEFKMRTKNNQFKSLGKTERSLQKKKKQSTKTEETKVYFKYVRFTLNGN